MLDTKACVCGQKICWEATDIHTGEVILLCALCYNDLKDDPCYTFKFIA